LFRRGPRDETILLCNETIFRFDADIPKRSLINNWANEAAKAATRGASHAERYRHQCRSPPGHHRRASDLG
jgi:hypothetical protein